MAMDALRGDMKYGEPALPQDHEDQMQLGIRIMTNAFQNRMHSLEQEIRGLRLSQEEQRTNVQSMQKKNSGLEVDLVQSHQRQQQLVEENKELNKNVNSLQKQLARLEGLKQAVMSSIQNDHAAEAELGDMKYLMSEEFLIGSTPLTAAEMGHAPRRPAPGNYARSEAERPPPAQTPSAPPIAARQQQQQQQHQQHQQHQQSTSALYGGASFDAGHSSGYGAGLGGLGHAGLGAGGGSGAGLGGPAQGMSGIGGGGAIAGAGGASTVLDGKQFFRQARGRLSYEAFNHFLASIKRLNNQQQTREEALEEARRIFGVDNQDLYKEFEALLSRHAM